MKFLIQSAMIFFGTLMVAGVIALVEPASDLGAVRTSAPGSSPFAASARPQQ